MNDKNSTTIAIIDDTYEISMVISLMLKSAGYSTLVFADGESFLNDVNCYKVDLVLLDILMPGLSGFEVCKQFKSNIKSEGIPVIFTTALKQISDKERAFGLGAADYIIKPINRPELLARVNNQLTIYFLRKRLEQMNMVLEEKVKERTNELKLVNNQLVEKEERLLNQNQALINLNKRLSKKNTQLITAKEKAQENEKLKTAFLANMSHEIRTPMNGIVGFCSLLENPSLKQEKKGLYLAAISNSCHQLLTIVNGILDISKLEANQLCIESSSFELEGFMNKVFVLFQNESDEKDLIFELLLEKNVGLKTINTDESKLEQVLTNLLSNAFKFTHEGKVSFGYKLKDTEVEFFVSDTGIGIPVESQQVIFDRFRQGDCELGRKYGGTGLGLAITQQLVKLLGGKLWLDSEPNIGSTFYFTLPVKKL